MSEGSSPKPMPTPPIEDELELEVTEPDGTSSRVICVAISETPAVT